MTKESIKVMFTDLNRPFTLTNIQNLFEWRMASKNYSLELSERPDFLFYSCNGDEHLKYNCTRIFYTPENVRPDYNHCDYAFSFDYPITERNYRLPLYRRWPEYGQLFKARDPDRVMSENRKFCSFMVSNPNASERIDFFNSLSKYKRVDSCGRLLNNIGMPVQSGVENKLNLMRNYKFSITFENSSYPGYTTEKLMHGLITDTIPIYWGNPLVGLDFNPKAFINCLDFNSFDEVIDHVIKVDQNEDLYREYLSQPMLTGGVETEFCREENILARYTEIIQSNKAFVSPSRKHIQRMLYPGQKTVNEILKKTHYRAGEYFDAGKRRLHELTSRFSKRP